MRDRLLTQREKQVLDLIGLGKTTKEVAAILKLSTGTIGNHRKSICRKLDAHSTAELVACATLTSMVRRTALTRALLAGSPVRSNSSE
jgi:DNA-binding CsgD family transcriptional regulator